MIHAKTKENHLTDGRKVSYKPPTDLDADDLTLLAPNFVKITSNDQPTIKMTFTIYGGCFVEVLLLPPVLPDNANNQHPKSSCHERYVCCTLQYVLSSLSAFRGIATSIIVLFQKPKIPSTQKTCCDLLLKSTLNNENFAFITSLHLITKALFGDAPVTIRKATDNPIFCTPQTDKEARRRHNISRLLNGNSNCRAWKRKPGFLLPLSYIDMNLPDFILAALYSHPKSQALFRAQKIFGLNLREDWQKKLEQIENKTTTRCSISCIRKQSGYISWVIAKGFYCLSTHGSAQNFWPKMQDVINLNLSKEAKFVLGWITSGIFIISVIPAIGVSGIHSLCTPPPWECYEGPNRTTCCRIIIMDILTTTIILTMMTAYALPLIATMPTVVNRTVASFKPDGKIPDELQPSIKNWVLGLTILNVSNFLLSKLLTGQLGRAWLSSEWRACLCFGPLRRGLCLIKENIFKTASWGDSEKLRCHKYPIVGLSLLFCGIHAFLLISCYLITFRNSLNNLDDSLSLNGTLTQEPINLLLATCLTLVSVSINLDWADKQTYTGLTTFAYYLVTKTNQLLRHSRCSAPTHTSSQPLMRRA